MPEPQDAEARALAEALWDAPVEPDLGFRRNCDEMAAHLVALGYRLTRVEHVHAAPYSAQPGGTMDFEAIERIVRSSPATHRRRVFKSPWEPIPDGETAPSDGITYSQDGQP
ncbi:hypothetical protein PBI_SMARTIES_99 [Microbacterium phage Smarties]|uniref:Uncharacterized protein n=1 Tax=Microbacterium phage Ariadne TaxID=2656546 RepID=A0A649VC04_9CAUD|nr:hypothetical protein QDA10_gp099 [Microbacterium phage Ariadne]QGJ89502.1 hypothetical protein PBI_ARIADNE_99 [Microbacterium phage Ariadne]QGJ91489.1 hypothetical protein PBI_SMARTIES_99 [Microbacterium phage Smarties]